MGVQGGFHIRASLEVHLGSPLFAVINDGLKCQISMHVIIVGEFSWGQNEFIASYQVQK